MYVAKKKWPNFEKKFFFRIIHEISKYRKIFKCNFDDGPNPQFYWLIAQLKERRFIFQELKKFGRGRKWVKFHFENIGRFFNLKNHVISWVSWIITIFCRIFIVHARNLHIMTEIFSKNFEWGQISEKIQKKTIFSKISHIR